MRLGSRCRGEAWRSCKAHSVSFALACVLWISSGMTGLAVHHSRCITGEAVDAGCHYRQGRAVNLPSRPVAATLLCVSMLGSIRACKIAGLRSSEANMPLYACRTFVRLPRTLKVSLVLPEDLSVSPTLGSIIRRNDSATSSAGCCSVGNGHCTLWTSRWLQP